MTRFIIWTNLSLGFRGALFLLLVCGCSENQPLDRSYERYWVSYQHKVDDLIGIETEIKTSYGSLVGEAEQLEGEEECFSWAYCGIAKEQDEQVSWCQAGFGKIRRANQIYVHRTYRAEVMGDDWLWWLSCNVSPDYYPLDGTWHKYRCDLDLSTGSWTCNIDDSLGESFGTDMSWQSAGQCAVWETEISHFENDMPGSQDFPCIFKYMKYRREGGDFEDARCDRSDFRDSDDRTQWTIEADTSASYLWEIRIWDKFPQMVNPMAYSGKGGK